MKMRYPTFLSLSLLQLNSVCPWWPVNVSALLRPQVLVAAGARRLLPPASGQPGGVAVARAMSRVGCLTHWRTFVHPAASDLSWNRLLTGQHGCKAVRRTPCGGCIPLLKEPPPSFPPSPRLMTC
ncbi:Hypothetical protein SMAX5B_018514 [Scophthalmus maximus]|uniref:Secreted protein n=1 Tax=Scophthalmus maximus TaxID=52904 RepID=A0A2U9CD41_SCOMX|nr:Hypothetical protein SMAX5B_018514 [Scophthalmus maximus]